MARKLLSQITQVLAMIEFMYADFVADHNVRTRLNVMVVEDTLASQRLLAAVLRSAGHDVRIAANGVEALRAFSRHPPDAVVMDLQMPILDGLQTTAILRQVEDEHIPIIAVTARNQPLDREECLAAGVDAFLSKPIDSRELNQLIVQLAAPRTEEQDAVSRPDLTATAPADTEAIPARVMNLDAALSRINGDDRLLRELIALFFEDFPALLDELHGGVLRHDWHRIHRAAHTLRGVVANFDAAPSVEAVRAVEASCAKRHIAETSALMRAVDHEIARLAVALAEHCEIPREEADPLPPIDGTAS